MREEVRKRIARVTEDGRGRRRRRAGETKRRSCDVPGLFALCGRPFCWCQSASATSSPSPFAFHPSPFALCVFHAQESLTNRSAHEINVLSPMGQHHAEAHSAPRKSTAARDITLEEPNYHWRG